MKTSSVKPDIAPRGTSYRVIGSRPPRPDGTDKVTGRALFGADIALPGLLYGAVLRSPHAHAWIHSVDTSRAEALAGVRAVVTAADLPALEDKIAAVGEGTANLRYQSENILARTKVLYHGHAVAAVAANSSHIAQEALALIQVEYEVLPAVVDVRQAMEPGAPILLDDLRTDELGSKGNAPSNIASHIQHQRGNLDEGFHRADVIVEREFSTSMVHQGYIEPQTATALCNADGQITIWCSTQGAFGAREQVAEILGVPVSRIRVIPTEIGGGFGGKNPVYLEPVAVLLSRKSGHRPVKMTMNRSEVFLATGPTSGSYIRLRMGANRAGKITAAQVYLAYEAGAFPGSPVNSAAGAIFAPYRIENLQIDGYDVVVNKPKTAAYRAPGGANAIFACETVVDELAERLGIDPLEFRLANAVREGDRRPDGPVYDRIGYLETIAAARNHPHYTAPLPGPNCGRGVATAFWYNWGGQSSASASLNSDGTIGLVVGSVDLSGTRTTLAMQMAETLGIPVADVKPLVADTDAIAYTEGSYGSRTTFATGWAVCELGEALIRQLKARAAEWWNTGADQVTFADGLFAWRDRTLSIKELAAHLDETGGPLMASATVQTEKHGPTFAAHIVDVEVDPETGKVQVLRYTAAQDVGTAVHPDYVEGQFQGGVAQGIGWGLSEEYVYDRAGHLLNPTFLDYRIPTCLDLPMIDTVLVEVPNPGHPYGVRGVGEASIVPPPAAIANAIHRAIGIRLTTLPMSPPRVLEAIWGRQGGSEVHGPDAYRSDGLAPAQFRWP